MKTKAFINKKRKTAWLFAYFAALVATAFLSVSVAIPDNQTYFSDSESSTVLALSDGVQTTSGNYTVTAKLFGVLPVKEVNVKILPETNLVPGGDVFGVKFFTKGVIVIGSTEIETENGFVKPADISDIRKNDIINRVNDTDVNTVEQLAELIINSEGKPLKIEYTRGGKNRSTELLPVRSKADNKYKSGIWVRDSTAGIGTITYYNPSTGEFAGLGHGICDIDTGELMPLLSGTVVDVNITDIIKGKSGEPGELKGSFSSAKTGEIYQNTGLGVFGKLNCAPKAIKQAVKAAGRDEVTEGAAVILVNPDGKGIKEYTVNLSKIDKYSDGTKCFVIEVTDKNLLSLTGGIVQGM